MSTFWSQGKLNTANIIGSAVSTLTIDTDLKVLGTINASTLNATQLRSVPISATLPTNGQVLSYNGSVWIPTTSGGGGGGGNGTVTSITAASPLTGGTITTSGTIGLGTVTESNGGTNQTTYTKGDMLYSGSTNTLSKLPIGTTGQYLISTDVPSWQTFKYTLLSKAITSETQNKAVDTSELYRRIAMLNWSNIQYPSPGVTTYTSNPPGFGWSSCTDGFGHIYFSTNDGITKVNVSDGSVVSSYSTGTPMLDICFDGVYLWATSFYTNTVYKLNIGLTTASTFTASLNGPYGIAYDATYNNIWVCNNADTSVIVMNATTGSVVTTINTGFNNYKLATDGQNMWVTNYGTFGGSANGQRVFKILLSSPYTLTTINTGTGAFLGPAGIAFDGQYMWIAAGGSGGSPSCFNIHVGTNAVGSALSLSGTTPVSTVFDGKYIYVSCLSGKIDVFDTATPSASSVANYNVSSGAWGMCFDGIIGSCSIWIKSNSSNNYDRLGPTVSF